MKKKGMKKAIVRGFIIGVAILIAIGIVCAILT